MHERLSGDIVDVFNLRRVGSHVVRAAGSGVNSTSNNSISEGFLINLKVEDLVDSLVAGCHHLVEGGGLSSSSGESIEHESTFAHGLGNVVVDKSNNEIIGYKLSGLHDSVSLLSKRSVSLDSGSEHISGSEMADAEFVLNHGSLSSLTSTGGTDEDQVKLGLLGALESSLDFSKEVFCGKVLHILFF